MYRCDIPETPIDALEKARQLKKHASAKKHIILVTDAKYKTDNRYGIKDMDEMIDLLCKDDITVSVVSHEYRRDDYKKLYEKTGGKFAAVSQNFAEQCGQSSLSEGTGDVNDGDNAGVYFNREFANEHAEGKAMYNSNCAYKREISATQLKKIIRVCEDKNYFNLATNNCAKVAVKAWNKACPRDIFSTHVPPMGLKNEINQKLGSFHFDMAKEVPNIR